MINKVAYRNDFFSYNILRLWLK